MHDFEPHLLHGETGESNLGPVRQDASEILAQKLILVKHRAHRLIEEPFGDDGSGASVACIVFTHPV